MNYLLELPLRFMYLFKGIAQGHITTVEPFFFTTLIFAALVTSFVWATKWVRYTSVSTAIGEIKIPLRLSWLGTEPTGWAAFFVMLPATIASFNPRMPGIGPLAQAFNTNIYLSLGAYAVFICLFTFLYIRVVYKDSFTLKSIQNAGLAFTDSIEKIKQKLNTDAKKLCLTLSFFLVGVVCLPSFLIAIHPIPVILATFIEDLMLLYLIGIIFDTQAQVNFYNQMNTKAVEWKLWVTCTDEVSASVLMQKLDFSGIKTLVKPNRLTWRLPIRTALEQYEIYVAAEDLDKAKQLLS